MWHSDILEPDCEVNHSEFVCRVKVMLGACHSSSWLGWHVLGHIRTITKLHFWLPMHIMTPGPLLNKSFVYLLWFPFCDILKFLLHKLMMCQSWDTFLCRSWKHVKRSTNINALTHIHIPRQYLLFACSWIKTGAATIVPVSSESIVAPDKPEGETASCRINKAIHSQCKWDWDI